MRRIILAFLVTTSLSLSHTFADTEFQDRVPLDLVKAVLGNTSFGEPRLFSDLSSAFPAIALPAQLEIMGSIDRGYGTAAVFSTGLSSDETDTALAASYLAAGYIEFDVPGSRDLGNGFVRTSAIPVQRSTRFCHDSLGFLSHSYAPRTQGGIVTISSNWSNDNRSCVDQLQEQTLAMSRMNGPQRGLHQYLPRMELPETQTQRIARVGWSNSNQGLESEAPLNIDWEIDAVFNHISEQISDQDWTIDSENIGTSSATGNWTRSPEPGVDLIGTLTVLKLGEESYELKFQLTSTGGSTNPNAGVGIFRAF